MAGKDNWAAAARTHSLGTVLWTFVLCAGLGQVFRGFDSPAGMAVSCLLNAAALLIATWLWRPPAATLSDMTPALVVAAATVGWAMTATTLVSERWPEFATPRLLALLSGLFALVWSASFAQATGEKGVVRLLDRLLILTCAATAVGLVLLAGESIGVLDYWTVKVHGRFGGAMGNANLTAAVAGFSVIYAVGRLLRLTRRNPGESLSARIVFFGGAAALMATALMLTGSRLPAFATAIALAIQIVSALRIERERKLRLLSLAVAVLVIGGLLFALVGQLSLKRVEHLSPDLDYRMELWIHLTRIVSVAPFTGFGLGSFPEVHAHFLTTPRMAEKYWTTNSAHNIALQLLIVGGWPYLLLLIGLAGLIVTRVLRRMMGRWSIERVTLAAMPAMLLACATVDIALDVPATTTLFALTAGLLWGLALQRHESGVAHA